ncbi:MAG: GcrA family cell cycle regulator [Acetobacteraceae bacterium]
MEWNEETINRLRALWAEGHSTAEIGRRLGVSKNAIVGKAHRLDLAARPSPIRRDPSDALQARQSASRRGEGSTLPPLTSTDDTPRVVAAKPAVTPVVPITVPTMVAAPVSPSAPARPVVTAPPRLAPVSSRPYGRVITCCWPIGEPGTRGFRFCDASSEPGKPYCIEHAKLAYVKVRDRRDDAA